MKEFNKVIGYEPIKKELERIVDMMVNPEYYKKLGVTTTRGLLINGEPGVGKTLMAKCLIKASKRESFTVRKDAPDGKFVEHIKNTFEKAMKAAPSIVFLDDLDKFANEDEGHRNAEEFVTIQSCIDECKDTEVFVLATTNELHAIPRSLLRAGRFDKRIDVETPQKEDVEKIIAYYLKNKKVDKDIDIQSIARLLKGGSCAELETVINEAGVFAGFEKRNKISMNDIIRAFLRVVYRAPETIQDITKPEFKAYAVHEAGHALVGELLEPGTVTLATIREHDGDAGGFVHLENCDGYFGDIKHMENRVKAILAGKAATEIVFGKVDTGARSDIGRAFSIVERFYNVYCINGYEFFQDRMKDSTDDENSKRNALVANTLTNYEKEVKELIVNNRDKLDKLTALLLKKDTIIFDEIEKIVRA